MNKAQAFDIISTAFFEAGCYLSKISVYWSRKAGEEHVEAARAAYFAAEGRVDAADYQVQATSEAHNTALVEKLCAEGASKEAYEKYVSLHNTFNGVNPA